MLELNRVARIFDQFEKDRNIIVTEKARTQLVDLINCVQTDPHETWEPQFDRLENYFRKCQERLPEILGEIVDKYDLKIKITPIDIVYWTGQNLRDRGIWTEICPFPTERGDKPTMMARFPWSL